MHWRNISHGKTEWLSLCILFSGDGRLKTLLVFFDCRVYSPAKNIRLRTWLVWIYYLAAHIPRLVKVLACGYSLPEATLSCGYSFLADNPRFLLLIYYPNTRVSLSRTSSSNNWWRQIQNGSKDSALIFLRIILIRLRIGKNYGNIFSLSAYRLKV